MSPRLRIAALAAEVSRFSRAEHLQSGLDVRFDDKIKSEEGVRDRLCAVIRIVPPYRGRSAAIVGLGDVEHALYEGIAIAQQPCGEGSAIAAQRGAPAVGHRQGAQGRALVVHRRAVDDRVAPLVKGLQGDQSAIPFGRVLEAERWSRVVRCRRIRSLTNTPELQIFDNPTVPVRLEPLPILIDVRQSVEMFGRGRTKRIERILLIDVADFAFDQTPVPGADGRQIVQSLNALSHQLFS